MKRVFTNITECFLSLPLFFFFHKLDALRYPLAGDSRKYNVMIYKEPHMISVFVKQASLNNQ